MKLNTAIAIAVAAAFAVPFAAQASAETDRIILAQTPGKTTTDPKDSNPAAPPATPGAPKSEAGATSRGGFSAVDKNGDGHLSRDEAKDATWSNRFSELDKDNDGRLSQSEFNAMQAGAGATSGTSAADRKPSTPKQ